jgi:hypothetical protein
MARRRALAAIFVGTLVDQLALRQETFARRLAMYLARFSYDVLPVNRERAIEFIRREVEAAQREGLSARLLVPLTRGQGGAALQFEVELGSLDQLHQVRHRAGPEEDTAELMRAFSEILTSPPAVEILRVDT